VYTVQKKWFQHTK